MKEIIPDIFTWHWFSEPHGYNFNGYFIRLPDGNVCVDPVEPSADELDDIARRGVSRILLTNRNHSRAANQIRARTGAKSAMHPADAPHARAQNTEVDEELRAADRIGPLDVIGVPGKSPGEIALYWAERKILIVGDSVVGNPPGRCKLLPEKVIDDPAGLRASVKSLLALDFDALLPGDGDAILDGARERLRELVDTFPA